MKIIFLDIDGVLNSERTARAVGAELGCDYFDPVGILLIKDIIDKTGAKIVISSTWRLRRSHDELYTIMKVAGFRCNDLYYEHFKTGRDENHYRGNEIAKWMAEHGKYVEKYICIDDDGDFYEHQNLVKVDGRAGISADNHQEALDILGENNVNITQ